MRPRPGIRGLLTGFPVAESREDDYGEGATASTECVTPVAPVNGIARGALASLRAGFAH